MKIDLSLDYGTLKQLTDKPDFENIVIGTGALARDVRQKLILLGLKAPFLIGDRSDPEHDILHYDELTALGDPSLCRFIICCDMDEWALVDPAEIAAHRFLGSAARNHPRLIEFSKHHLRAEHGGKQRIDSGNCNLFLHGGRPYVVYGDESDCAALRIFLVGGCNVSGTYRLSPDSLPEALHDYLCEAGVNCAVFAWGQPVQPLSNYLYSFIRDMCFMKADLIMMCSTSTTINSFRIVHKNVLFTNADSVGPKSAFVQSAGNHYNGDMSSGISYNVQPASLRITIQRIFIALSKLHGFAFQDVIMPSSTTLPKSQAYNLRAVSPGYLARERARHEQLMSVLNKQYTWDYTDTFSESSNLFSMFADDNHYSKEGRMLIAKRMAGDIIKNFCANKGV